MMQLEIHIVATANSQEILELAINRIKEILEIYSEEDNFLRFTFPKITKYELGGGITEVGDVQKEP
jgi:hypothetical protein